MAKDTVKHTILVALILCLVCSVVVSGAAVGLRDMQKANKEEDKKGNILKAAGLYQEGVSIDEQFKTVTAKVVDLSTGRFTDAVDVASFDQRKASKDPALSDKLSADQDIAKIGRKEKYATVYMVEGDNGIEKMILPIKGYALWSTLYGFVALEGDFNTVAGLGFYEHKETPGLGGEVDNPSWKALWVGKQIYNGDQTAISVIKGAVDNSKPEALYQVDGLSGATLTSKGVHNLMQFWMGDSGFAPFLANLKAGEA
ncbi:Na(+)-translocating NADH-quinone reductase subunit C [Porticoccus sp. W117]|uniref:Na(+)-translocating NADH-quinone reductase subunit C n=1 Tax=Porticoccus sp. W117 TaxID=3054777 RepID=UPI002598A2F8|nr:Na(+)-translocating NADH-quinone reductase subunit C [Porticoccus sp. W117]MDM3869917.1 Na(+)-translocating NADH-quinone reductase subunit C [Porticoccus sp. W117]